MSRQKGSMRRKSIVERFSIVFAILYVIPMLVSLYLLLPFLELEGKAAQVTFLVVFLVLLGLAGRLILRAIVKSLVDTVDDVEAVASGDLSRRARPSSGDELHDLANNVNRITERLQKNIEDLQSSKQHIQTLLSHISRAVASPVEIDGLLTVTLSSMVDIIGYRKGVVTVIGSEGEFRIISHVGLSPGEESSFPVAGKELLGRVIDCARPLVLHRGRDGGWKERGLREFQRFFGDSVSVPLIRSYTVFGVLTVASGRGDSPGSEGSDAKCRKIGGDDVLMLQNLAAQVATAIDNAELRKSMEKTYFESISSLAAAVEARDIYTNGHSKRVSELSGGIAAQLRLPEYVVKLVKEASLLHDIGKIGIPDTILHNSSRKSPDDYFEVIKTHPVIGENIVKPMHSLRRLCPGVRHHHERVDGHGYPDGLSGDAIPIEARIMAVADAFDAMTSDRLYRSSLSRKEAVQQLWKNAGFQFDSQCVKALLAQLRDDSAVKNLRVGGTEIMHDSPGASSPRP
ncbi:MAG: HD domain-containing protein [Deltaproteobacteria bacterium]|nr:HD domain-containing protein [Deltaproteobacteria bacterium]NIS76063.1 HD domain-containing protein [Deltaproteobacteria bacterium]